MLRAMAEGYDELLQRHGAVAVCADPARKFTGCSSEDRRELLNHARWQMEMTRRVLPKLGGEAAALRLLGAAQGVLVSLGVLTVGEAWLDNGAWMDPTSVAAFEQARAELEPEAAAEARRG